MGARFTAPANPKLKITIVTGSSCGQNVQGNGKGNVCLRFHCENGEMSTVYTCSGSYFASGSTRTFNIPAFFEEQIQELEIWIERTGDDSELKWFVDMVKCTKFPSEKNTIFPMRRWITMRHQLIRANDSILPQYDPNAEQRREAILMDRQFFKFTHSAGGIPTMTNVQLPSEKFSTRYFGNVFLREAVWHAIKGALIPLFTRRWESIEDLQNIYDIPILNYAKPKSVSEYMKVLRGEPSRFDQRELDKMFAAQRLTGTNPVVIERVKNLIDLTDRMKVQPVNKDQVETLEDLLKPHLGGFTLQEAINEKKLFMVDYTHVLRDIKCKTNMIPAPIALFFVDTVEEKQQLLPIAIQLFKFPHESSGVDNPIFLPTDDSYTWLLAKMWFNLADASYHESVSHLGFTHLLMETVYLALCQTVSLSHPLYRLMAPHFLYLTSINATAWSLLLNEGGWVDTKMSIGVDGMFDIVRRRYEGADGCQPWRFNVEGNIENDIQTRGVEDIPNYTFRDDALKLRGIIKRYVKDKVQSTYGDEGEKLSEDYEIQAWGGLMSKPTADGGCGIKGLAFEERLVLPVEDKSDEKNKKPFKYKEELIETITTVIYTCSVAHAAVNFLQYEEYGFPLNYPALLYGDPPRNKRTRRTAKDILQALPTKKQTLGTMDVTQLLSQKSTYDKYLQNQLGHFPIQYQFTQDGETPQNVIDFQNDLGEFAAEIERRAEPYDILDPTHIPNSISI